MVAESDCTEVTETKLGAAVHEDEDGIMAMFGIPFMMN